MTRRGDAGFTLVELLVTVAILGIVVPVLAGVFFNGTRLASATSATLTASHNRQMLASVFTTDVQDAASNDTAAGCTVAGDTVVTHLSWNDVSPSGATSPRDVTYVLATVAGDQQLIRRECSAGGAPSSVVVGHGVTAATLTTPSPGTLQLSVTDPAGTFTATGVERS